MAERRKLGRGLSTLIPTGTPPAEATPPAPSTTSSSAPASTDKKLQSTTTPPPAAQETRDTTATQSALPDSALREVPVGSIEPNPHQPRVHFDEDSLKDLASSIKEIGVLQPLLVREISPGSYQLIAGERRWRAAQRAKLSMVPVVVREVTELDSVEQALVENLHRQDLTALEEASAYQQLAEDFGLTHEMVAKRVGKSRSAVTNSLRLLTLPATVQGYLADGRLSAGHAKALLSCDDAKVMEQLAADAVKSEWSVRATEDAVRQGAKALRPEKKPTTPALRPAGLLELENLLADFLSTRVSVSMAGKRGRISIDFADLEDLERIYRKMAEGE
jgi:ParB family transcriptional regulator, chromosome partitioning protein